MTTASSSGVRQRHDTERYSARYKQAIQMALKWMDRQKATQQRLADHLDVKRTTLTKFLAEYPDFHPTSGRPVMLSILERIETCCAVYDLVEEEYMRPVDAESTDDEYTWYRHHTIRLRQLANKLDPVTALSVAPELCAQALYAPPRYRSAMAVNVAMRLAFMLERPEASCTTPRLLRQTVERLVRLEEVAHAAASDVEKPAIRATIAHKATGYAGHGLCHCGVLLNDSELIERGISGLLTAAASEHTLEVGHWPNLFRVIEALFERARPEAGPAADRALQLARDTWAGDDKIRYTLVTRNYPHLMEHWQRQAPGLVDEIRTKREDSHV